MEIFSQSGLEILFRWTHFLAGITWIGLLYYFNFVQAPFVAQAAVEVKGAVTRQLAPRALAWFRYGALVTFLAGFALILSHIDDIGWANWDERLFSGNGLAITTGMFLGTIMLLNVWGVIWRNQKIIIASAEATAAGGEADPRAADAARRGLLASRTNVVLSIPMLFFMGTSAHFGLFAEADVSKRVLFVVLTAAVSLLVEMNALIGLTGETKKPLEKIGSTIFSGFVLWAIIYAFAEIFVGA
jgi:uncharacterized membrane protein